MESKSLHQRISTSSNQKSTTHQSTAPQRYVHSALNASLQANPTPRPVIRTRPLPPHSSRSYLRQRHVLVGDGVDLGDHLVRLLHLAGDLGRLLLQRLQRGDDAVVVQDLALGVVQRLQQRLLQVAQPQVELA